MTLKSSAGKCTHFGVTALVHSYFHLTVCNFRQFSNATTLGPTQERMGNRSNDRTAASTHGSTSNGGGTGSRRGEIRAGTSTSRGDESRRGTGSRRDNGNGDSHHNQEHEDQVPGMIAMRDDDTAETGVRTWSHPTGPSNRKGRTNATVVSESEARNQGDGRRLSSRRRTPNPRYR